MVNWCAGSSISVLGLADLLGLDAQRLHDRAPLAAFTDHEVSEVFWTPIAHNVARASNLFFDLGLGQCLVERGEDGVTHASAQEPLLGLMLTFDRQDIEQWAADMPLAAVHRAAIHRSVDVEWLDERVAWDLVRLIELLDQPQLLTSLAPLIQQEIIIRLLTGPHAPQLLRLVGEGSPSQQISKAVAWIKNHFAQIMKVDELADRVHMSPSTFRQHFRTMTGTSPLQYQKQLRLQEARYLMLSQKMDAGHAGHQVGYESASQFSREYNRLFGLPPQQDIQRIRKSDERLAPAQLRS